MECQQIVAPTMINPQLTMEQKMQQMYAKGFSNKDDWSAYKSSHPCWTSFSKISECFSSLCSEACMQHESEVQSSQPKITEVNKQRCFYQALEQLIERLIVSHEKMLASKKALFSSNPSLLVAKPEPLSMSNPMYIAGCMKGKYDYLASNRPCHKYFPQLTDAMLCLSMDACEQVEYRCDLIGNEILDNLQREIIFFKFLHSWTNSKCLERLECAMQLLKKPQAKEQDQEQDKKEQELQPPLMSRPQEKPQDLAYLANVAMENPWQDCVQPTKKLKVASFWDFFEETFPNEQTNFVLSILNYQSQEYCVLYSYGAHFPNEWKPKKMASLRKSNGEVVISGRKCKGLKISKGGDIPDNSLLKLNCNSRQYPKTFFIVWNPLKNVSRCPANTYCDSQCPNEATCPKSS